ncbi:uncharacterized protein PHALS_01902 [Plasmopara halstedii]|uniref:Uncharacterized protein n=1 Tax=Plasmopara halstedii TaxID=4781 RepID=A0A0P1AXT4_PLAHL|nr:uncharacterized protein PHALS_01902 [Plasmopara halstedii]CEG45617.1 hypothetical protein PHALS_01902 [Plasmopara halstedii]|eukprot:XP_024581986.1 hypothetical protein PHALS_01902 [Plasmopara halstedii]
MTSTQVFTDASKQTSSTVGHLRTLKPAVSHDDTTNEEERNVAIVVPPSIVPRGASEEFNTVTTYNNNGLLQRAIGSFVQKDREQ